MAEKLQIQIDPQEVLQDYLGALPEMQRDVEVHVHCLLKAPKQASYIHGLYRALHNLKSNAAMCQLEFVVEFAHPLEDVIAAIRSSALHFTPELAEVVLLAVDRIKLAVEAVAAGQPIDGLQLPIIGENIRQLGQLNPEQAKVMALRIIGLFGGRDADVPPAESPAAPADAHAVLAVADVVGHPLQADLVYFRQLARLTERRSLFWEDRTARILPLALSTNQMAGQPVDPVQLEAAVYMHDVGMAFLTDEIWSKQGKLNEIEQKDLRTHPLLAYEQLRRLACWQAAAEMVAQHHERVDGRGYPNALADASICLGAKLLSIVDAFEAMTHERGDRYHKRSVLRSVTEINACEGQFAREWLQPFNGVVRRLIAGSLVD